jgi:hypothetical protein
VRAVREGIEVLGERDVPEFLALTDRDPVVNVFAAHRARTTNLEPRWLGGEVWGRFEAGRLVAACHVGANLVPVECTAARAVEFAERAAGQGRGVATLVGPQEPVAAMWEVLEPVWGQPRELRWNQVHMALDADPAVAPDPLVRVTPGEAVDVLYPACVAMYREEVGTDPEQGSPRGLYRTRVKQLVSRGWSFSRIEDGEVVFKAEVASATPRAAQVQGVWVHPDRRGEGLSVPGMAAVVALVRRDVAPVCSLYVNAWNTPARRAYERVGFRRTATFATIMF